MPRIGLTITKSTPFRNSVQEFSNTYYYEMLSLPDNAAALTLIDNMVTLEKTFHSTGVTFVRAKLWSAGQGAAANQMIAQKNLSGTGARSASTGIDKERAYLFRLKAGNDSRGNPVYLRKWYHACGLFYNAQTITNGQLDNSTGFSQAERDSMVAQMNAIGGANGSAGAPKLCAKGGRQTDAGATWTAHPFFEHHQLGDMWRSA